MLLELRHRWADGTTHLLFDPVELLERLAALTPRPRINLVLYYGVLGARGRGDHVSFGVACPRVATTLARLPISVGMGGRPRAHAPPCVAAGRT